MSIINNSFFSEIFETQNQEVFFPLLTEKKVKLFVKREDLIHPFVSGNKFRKLKHTVLQVQKAQQKNILTFGGAFSNHIAATAHAGKIAGLKTIGVIRGDELGKDLEKTLAQNATLREAYKCGMTFYFVDRETYRTKTTTAFIQKLKDKFGDFYLVPEGGTNELAIKGCEEILSENENDFTHICSAVGTGGTIAGLINTAKEPQKIIGFPALKGNFLTAEVEKFTSQRKHWELISAYHFGGYAKYNSELISFMNWFYKQTAILLDPIYTGKMMFGIVDLIKKNYFSENSCILAIHTGGIQGIEGFNQMLAKKQQELILQ